MAAILDQAKHDEIVRLADRGKTPAEIAAQLAVGEPAVRTHLMKRELELLREVAGPLLTPAEIGKLEVHEWCYLYREMTEGELDALADSIEEAGGLEEQILVWHDAVRDKYWIIDGRNRFNACRNRKIALGPADFKVAECDEAEARRKVDRLNLERRHLTDQEQQLHRSKRAMRAADAARGEDGRMTRESWAAAAREHGVSHATVGHAKQVADRSPEVADRLRRGEMTLQDARREVGLIAPKAGRTGPSNRTTLADVAEEYEERAANSEGDSDEEWVKSLDLYRKLSGKNRDAFVRDALAYRHLSQARKQWAAALAAEMKGNRRSPVWLSKQERAMATGGPEDWDFCSSEDGGCDGEGRFTFGDDDQKCGNCYGHGYMLKK